MRRLAVDPGRLLAILVTGLPTPARAVRCECPARGLSSGGLRFAHSFAPPFIRRPFFRGRRFVGFALAVPVPIESTEPGHRSTDIRLPTTATHRLRRLDLLSFAGGIRLRPRTRRPRSGRFHPHRHRCPTSSSTRRAGILRRDGHCAYTGWMQSATGTPAQSGADDASAVATRPSLWPTVSLDRRSGRGALDQRLEATPQQYSSAGEALPDVLRRPAGSHRDTAVRREAAATPLRRHGHACGHTSGIGIRSREALTQRGMVSGAEGVEPRPLECDFARKPHRSLVCGRQACPPGSVMRTHSR